MHGETDVTSCFSNASNGDIQLVVQDPSGDTPTGSSIDDFQLHTTLAALTGNPFKGPVLTIGVIFAGTYLPDPSVFGIMFDAGFDPDNSSYDAVAREGCAVFLERIASVRQDADFGAQVVYTTLHELGHVFNLYHLQNKANLMASSEATSAPTDAAFQFATEHGALLSRCSSSLHIQPGGSPWGDLGDLVSGPVDSSRFDTGRAVAQELELHIQSDLTEFYRFEPVELVVTLRCRPGARRGRIRIPRILDPGYDGVTIWIEEPSGERRRYRRSKLYCGTKRTIEIAADRPFQRDIPLFGQSGGYTFRHAGPHKVWMVVEHASVGRLRSNTITVNVKSGASHSGEVGSLAAILRPSRHARLLFYRSAAQHRTARRMAAGLGGISRFPSSANARYSIGCVFYRAALASRDETIRKALGSEGSDHLRKAVSDKRLSVHRRRRSDEMLGKIHRLARGRPEQG